MINEEEKQIIIKKMNNIHITKIKSIIKIFCELSDCYKNDEDIVFVGISKNPYLLEHLSEKFKDNEFFVLKAVRVNGFLLKHASERLRDNDDVVFSAVKVDAGSLMYASEQLKNNKNFIKKCAFFHENILDVLPQWKEDIDIALNVVSQYSFSLLKMSDNLKNNLDFIKMLMKKNANAYRSIENDLKDNEEVIELAIQGNVENILLIDKEKLKDTDFVLKILENFKKEKIFNYDFESIVLLLINENKDFKDLYENDKYMNNLFINKKYHELLVESNSRMEKKLITNSILNVGIKNTKIKF